MKINENCAECLFDKQKNLSDDPAFLAEIRQLLADNCGEIVLDKVAEVIDNGMPLAGTVYGLLPEKAQEAVDRADVILSKGQGNYESLSDEKLHVFYAFLCKCELFTERFGVPKLTGIFIEKECS